MEETIRPGALWHKRQAVHNRMESGETRGEGKQMRTGTPIRIIVHSPQNEAGKKELARRVAELYADCVLGTIRGLDCSPEQKRELLQAVIDMRKKRG